MGDFLHVDNYEILTFRRGVVKISNAEVDIDGANEIQNKNIQLASIAFKSKLCYRLQYVVF